MAVWTAGVRVWDLRTGTAIGAPLIGHTGGVSAVDCTLVDGIPVAVTGGRLAGGVRVWDLRTGQARGEPLPGPTGGVSALACTSVDGTPVAVTGSNDGGLRMWDLRTGTGVGEPLAGHTRGVSAVACSVADGTPMAATCGRRDNTVGVWNLRTGERVSLIRVPSPRAVSFASDGGLVVGMNNDVAVLSRRSLRPRR
ncbi:hypothetical protein [Streptomyces sp. MZ04]|uniref:WD40 repeat domain-containing protein n=1 Tax=Streptomyces sp. MZ04 TaxID=2559236 RepID=UPI0014333E0C|nr:hypothetical protein [Streptomyces sp. MZ04]